MYKFLKNKLRYGLKCTIGVCAKARVNNPYHLPEKVERVERAMEWAGQNPNLGSPTYVVH